VACDLTITKVETSHRQRALYTDPKILDALF